MRRKLVKIDINELIEADDPDRTTKKGEMRKLYPEIHKKLSLSKWTARDMVLWLEKRGLVLSVELFRVYLRELDREHGYSRSARKAQGSKVPAPSPPIFPGGAPGAPVAAASETGPKEEQAEVAQKSTDVLGGPKTSARPSILSNSKGIYGELKPSPVDGMVDLNQK